LANHSPVGRRNSERVQMFLETRALPIGLPPSAPKPLHIGDQQLAIHRSHHRSHVSRVEMIRRTA
jgi:hypothetical protein